jgi:hypothetical protein
MHDNALADPPHCDMPGWPTCYTVGYGDGLGKSGPCPNGHSASFCDGWYDATHSNLGSSSSTDCSRTNLTQNERYNCGYDHGYLDAQRDWNLDRFPPSSGGDNSCPRANTHTPEYCNGYQIGYTDSWNAHLNPSTSTSNSTAPPPSNATSVPPPSTSTSNSTAPPPSNATSNATSVPPPSTSTSNSTAPPPSNATSNATSVPTSQNRTQPSPAHNTSTVTNFLKYENSTYGIKIQYPSDWSVAGGNNPSIIASFYRQSDYRSHVIVQVEDLTTSYTLNQYLNSLMRGDAEDSKDFPDIVFTNNTISDVELAGHPGYLLNGTFRDPTSHALQEFTNIGTIIGDRAYSVIYYSPVQTYPIYIPTFSQMTESFEILPQQSHSGNQSQPSATPAPSTAQQSQNQTQQSANAPAVTNPPTDWRFGLLIIFIIIIYVVWKLRHRGGKYKERHYFSDSVKEMVLDKQHHRCADCNRVLNVVDWHHKNGDRSDNRESNCMALCPNCHAIRTRRH